MTYEEWIDKYFRNPKMVKVYEEKRTWKLMPEYELIEKYHMAFHKPKTIKK